MSPELKKLEQLYERFEEVEANLYLLGKEKPSYTIMVELNNENESVDIIDGNEKQQVDYNGFKKFIIDMLISIEILLDNIDLYEEYKQKVLRGKLTESEYIKYAGSITLARIKYEEISKRL